MVKKLHELDEDLSPSLSDIFLTTKTPLTTPQNKKVKISTVSPLILGSELVSFANGGTGTHTASDAHIASTANPHSTTAAQVAAIPNDGWIAITLGSPTRTANTTFTTTTDLTALWQRGFKLRFTDTTTKYAYVVGMSAYSAGSMTVTILGGTLVGNPSAFSYSPTETPLGFPASFSYTPTPTGITTTSGTLTGNYRVSGNEILVRVTFVFGASSAITGNVSFAMPIATATMAGTTIPVGFGQYFDSSASAVYTGVISDVIGTFYAQCFNAAGTYTAVNNLSSIAPFTWATGDEITATISYAIF